MATTTASAGSAKRVFGTASGSDAPAEVGPKRVLLISNRVMHYRVSVYNYFWRRFRDHGWDFVVLSNELQRQNENQCQFELIERPFQFSGYRAEIRAHQARRGHSVFAPQGSDTVAVDSLA